MEKKGVAYEEIDLSKNPQAARELVEVSGQLGVPVLIINGRVIVGYDPPRIDDALRIQEAG